MPEGSRTRWGVVQGAAGWGGAGARGLPGAELTVRRSQMSMTDRPFGVGAAGEQKAAAEVDGEAEDAVAVDVQAADHGEGAIGDVVDEDAGEAQGDEHEVAGPCRCGWKWVSEHAIAGAGDAVVGPGDVGDDGDVAELYGLAADLGRQASTLKGRFPGRWRRSWSARGRCGCAGRRRRSSRRHAGCGCPRCRHRSGEPPPGRRRRSGRPGVGGGRVPPGQAHGGHSTSWPW